MSTNHLNIFIMLRYDNELLTTRGSSVRKGVALGLFTGWTFFITHIIYSLGFICASLLMHYVQQNKLTISDSLTVSNSKIALELFACFCTDSHSFCRRCYSYWIHWFFLSNLFGSSRCSRIVISNN